MTNEKCEIYGFNAEKFSFNGRTSYIIFPKVKPNGRFLMKTEYFSAFPDTEIKLIEKGYTLTFLSNSNRWGTDADCDMRAEFADYISRTYGLEKRFIPVGMSCGGLHAVNYTSLYPDTVAAMWIDAPLLNLLSYPMGFGKATPDLKVWENELSPAYGFTLSDLITYRRHPMDRLKALTDAKIPVAMSAGDVDTTVPYEENGALLEKAYKSAGVPLYLEIHKGRNHHPHGIRDFDAFYTFLIENSL